MRYVGIAALAATFWLLVATVRLMVYPPAARVAPPALEIATARLTPIRPAPSKVSEDDCCPCRLGDISRAPSRDHGGGHPMSRVALVRGFNEVRPRVAECYQTYQVPGTAMVNVVIAPSGRVSSAIVTGKFAGGTPTGDCVERAVKTARFPESDGFSTPYPFQLR